MFKRVLRIKLHLHDGDQGDGGTSPQQSAPSGSEQPAAETVVLYGKEVPAETASPAAQQPVPEGQPAAPAPDTKPAVAPTGTPEERKAAYDKIRTEYKDLYEADLQTHLGRRLKGRDAEVTQLQNTLHPIMAYLGLKDMKALQSYIQEDILPKIQDNADYKAIVDATRKAAEAAPAADAPEAGLTTADLVQQGLALKDKLTKAGGDFDLSAEMKNETFAGLTSKGIDVETAYKIAHFDQIILTETQRAAEAQKKATIEAIKTRGLSAVEENAAKPAPKIIHKRSAADLTDEDLDNIRKQVMDGKPISF